MDDTRLITREYVNTVIKERPRQIHKGQCGRVLIIAGSKGMAGAAILAARGALKSGAGLVTIATHVELFPILQVAVPQATCKDVSDEDFLRSIDLYDSIAIGPGMGVDEKNYLLIKRILKEYNGSVVVDADGITNLCKHDNVQTIVSSARAKVIMTPHPGEANRLFSNLGEDIVAQLGREHAAEVISQRTGAVVLLKGADTVVCNGSDVSINTTGNPGMATGGSGDVLTGVIAAIVASGAREHDATKCGAFIHGLAGDIACEELGQYGMTSADIVSSLPYAFKSIVGK